LTRRRREKGKEGKQKEGKRCDYYREQMGSSDNGREFFKVQSVLGRTYSTREKSKEDVLQSTWEMECNGERDGRKT
jgi:hypothetical protein